MGLRKPKNKIEAKPRKEETKLGTWEALYLEYFKKPYFFTIIDKKLLNKLEKETEEFRQVVEHLFKDWDKFKADHTWFKDYYPTPKMFNAFKNQILDWHYGTKDQNERILHKHNLTDVKLEHKIRVDNLLKAEKKLLEEIEAFKRYRQGELNKIRKAWQEIERVTKDV